MTIQQAIYDYLKKVKLLVKESTYGYYQVNYRIIQSFCDIHGFKNLVDLPSDINVKFIDWLKNERCCSNLTINKRIEKLKQLLKFYKIKMDWFEDKRLKESYKTFDVIPENDLKKIINYVFNLDDCNINITFKVLIFILLDTGCRIDEALNIEIQNIDLINNTILLKKTKTNQERYVFFNQYTKELIKKYIKLNDRKLLFYNFLVNDTLKRGAVIRFLKKLKKELNIEKLHPHMFRHTFATLLINNEAPIFTVSKLLGHSDVKITMRYLHQNVKILKNEFDKYYPSLDKYKKD